MAQSGTAKLDVARIREDFPILKTMVNGKPLIYLDNAATSQKPQAVLDTLNRYYTEENSNIHRGVHYLSQAATKDYEDARAKVRRFLNASDDKQIIFVRGATEGINLVAGSYGRQNIGAGDEVIISAMEHHSNIVPWQILCQEKGASLKVIPINDDGELLMDEYEKLLSPRTKLVSVVHISNSLGTINPMEQIIDMAHARDVPVPGRRGPVSPPHAHRRPGAGLRLLRLLRPQGLWPHRHRRCVREDGPAGSNAAVPGRRRHD